MNRDDHFYCKNIDKSIFVHFHSNHIIVLQSRQSMIVFLLLLNINHIIKLSIKRISKETDWKRP